MRYQKNNIMKSIFTKIILPIIFLIIANTSYSQKVILNEEAETITISSKYVIENIYFEIADNVNNNLNYTPTNTVEVKRRCIKIDLTKINASANRLIIDYGTSFTIIIL